MKDGNAPIDEQVLSGTPAAPSRLLLLLLLGLSLLALMLSGAALGWQWQHQAESRSLNDLLRAAQQESRQSLSSIDARLGEQELYAVQFSEQLGSLSTRLTGIDVNDSGNAIVGLQRLLIRQERDYQDFLGSLEQHMLALDRMIPHSSGWWSEFEEDVRQSRALSEAREQYLFNLRQ